MKKTLGGFRAFFVLTNINAHVRKKHKKAHCNINECNRFATESYKPITTAMKRLNLLALFAVLVGSLCIVSCSEDDKNSFFYDEPEVEIQSYRMEGLSTCFFSCRIWPTKEMYENNLRNYEGGLEFSTDSLFRSSTKIVLGYSVSDDYIAMGRVGDFFPDSTYYFRALLILVDELTEEGQSFSGDRFGNRYVNKYTHIIKEGKTVSITIPHFDVNDYVHASVMELGPMNINIGVDKVSAGFTADNCSLEFSADSTFSDSVTVMPIKYYLPENKFEFKSLKPLCDYYYRVRIFFKDKMDKSASYYGDVVKVTTPALKTVNGMPYVDLGLSVMWANYNVGAHSALEPGGYYCWGETEELTIEGKRVETIDFINTIINYSKYNETDGLLVLQPQDDVATVKWGAPWHMPDKSDIEELNANCTNTVLTIDGQKVVKFTSKINGNYIIIPIAGWYGSGKYFDWDQAYFWTRTLDSVFVPFFAFSVRSDTWGLVSGSTRSNCLNVRPVVKP